MDLDTETICGYNGEIPVEIWMNELHNEIDAIYKVTVVIPNNDHWKADAQTVHVSLSNGRINHVKTILLQLF